MQLVFGLVKHINWLISRIFGAHYGVGAFHANSGEHAERRETSLSESVLDVSSVLLIPVARANCLGTEVGLSFDAVRLIYLRHCNVLSE